MVISAELVKFYLRIPLSTGEDHPGDVGVTYRSPRGTTVIDPIPLVFFRGRMWITDGAIYTTRNEYCGWSTLKRVRVGC